MPIHLRPRKVSALDIADATPRFSTCPLRLTVHNQRQLEADVSGESRVRGRVGFAFNNRVCRSFLSGALQLVGGYVILLSHIMKTDLEQVWRGLSNPIRRRILDSLRDGPSSTGEIVGAFPELSRFAIMQHLGVLEESGLLIVRREGRIRLNYLNAMPLRMLYERWVSEHAGMAAETAFRLKKFAETRRGGNALVEQRADRVVKVETEIRIEAAPESLFDALTRNLDAWWPFRFRADGRMVLECHVGGRCYEDWGDGKGAHHGVVVWWEPPIKYAATGPGAMTREFQSYDVATIIPDGTGSIYRKSLTLWGAVSDEVERSFTDGSKAILHQHLKAFLEDGVGYAKPNTN